MLNKVSSTLRHMVAEIGSYGPYWADLLKKTYNIKISPNTDYTILRQIYNSLSDLPVDLVKACKIYRMDIRDDMGPNRPYYPNHGYFVDHSVTLNSDIFYNPDDFLDVRGYKMSRPVQTLFHEFGHGFDEYQGSVSLKKNWLSLSGWSECPQKGLKRIIIKDPGTPEVVGEWYYRPDAGFTRYYGKRNPWDDYADCFCFYVGGMSSKLPQNKIEYFDKFLMEFK